MTFLLSAQGYLVLFLLLTETTAAAINVKITVVS